MGGSVGSTGEGPCRRCIIGGLTTVLVAVGLVIGSVRWLLRRLGGRQEGDAAT